MSNSFRTNVSANTIQLCMNQAFSLLVFYFLSKSLNKDDFGELNWTLAIFLSLFAVLSFGIDQMIVRKIAAKEDKSRLLSLHLFHVIITGIIFYASLLILSFIVPSFFVKHHLLLLLGIGKTVLFFSTPFKAVASGQENFKAVLYMSISSTALKGLCIAFLFYANKTGFAFVIPVFVMADCSELLFALNLTRKVPFIFQWNWKAYCALVKESVPQIGVVVFSSALARIDWILIGVFLSASKIAEYSFASKAFELATVPLLVIAPLLIPYFTRLAKEGQSLFQNENVQLLLRAEMAVACLVALCLNIAWNPFVDAVTNNKYGAVNTTTIFIFSISLPVLYLNNFLWTIHFAHGNLKTIFYSFVLRFVVNFSGNLLLIPLYHNEGAAFAFLLSITFQTLFYLHGMKDKILVGWSSLFFCSFCALCSGMAFKFFSLQIQWLLPFSILLYIFLLCCTIQLRRNDWYIFKQVMKL